MRIDLNQLSASQLASESSAKKVDGQESAISDAAGSEDRTTFTSDSSSVGSLVSAAMGTPDVRQSLVDSLRQSVNSGEYKLDPSAIASSMVDEQA
jgi:flagellar biosynthesis anti-sigma factor FlgM